MSTAELATGSREEKERLLDDFVRLCEIESPSRQERPCVDAVAADLREMGLEVEEDASGGETGSDSGNLIARIPGPEDARTIMLCAHLDTVPLEGPVKVERQNGTLMNAHEAILGADNKAAVAVILGVARRLARGSSPVGVELVFTTCEEIGLRGAKAIDRGALRSEYGFVFDHASPIGELIVAAPTYFRIDARFRGHAAHAGIRPEAGRNAIAAAALAISRLDLGRVDPETTANVGTIKGGTAANVVAEHCFVELEARSLDHGRAAEMVSHMVDAITEAASDRECDVETSVEEQNRGFRLARSSPPVAVTAAALEGLGIEPSYVTTGGCSDANIFVAAGLPCLCVANGTERNHQPDESVTVEALETMLDVTFGIVAQSA
ncbi:MAG TPA: M20/M25/M40 family metallo-hydrolase [Thermoleophilaceae bacterium]